MEELKKYKIKEIGKVVTGKTPSTQIESYFDGCIPFITPADISNNPFFLQDSERHISEEGYRSIINNTISGKSILVGCIGSDMGNVSIVDMKCATNQQLNSITKIKDAFDPVFIYYVLTTKKDYLRQLSSSTTTPILSKSNFEEIELSLPSLATQKRISSVLSHIDRLISTKRHENSTLEAMAKEIYDYWFVQFDFPNNDGKPYKSSGGKMVFNEILKREIPEGWEVKRLGEFLTIKNGKDHKHLDNGIFPVYGSGGFMRSVSQCLYEGESVLMPRKGSLNNVLYVNEAFWTVDTMFYSIPKIEHSAKYVYYSIKDIDFTRLNSGTGVPSMTSTTLYDIKLVKPSNELISQFDIILNPIYAFIFSNRQQIQNLTILRDYLLPLLMNGQVEVKEAETKFQEMYSEMAMAAEEEAVFGGR